MIEGGVHGRSKMEFFHFQGGGKTHKTPFRVKPLSIYFSPRHLSSIKWPKQGISKLTGFSLRDFLRDTRPSRRKGWREKGSLKRKHEKRNIETIEQSNDFIRLQVPRVKFRSQLDVGITRHLDTEWSTVRENGISLDLRSQSPRWPNFGSFRNPSFSYTSWRSFVGVFHNNSWPLCNPLDRQLLFSLPDDHRHQKEHC